MMPSQCITQITNSFGLCSTFLNQLKSVLTEAIMLLQMIITIIPTVMRNDRFSDNKP